MNQLACELNKVIEGTVAERLLSDFGRRMYFPNGIIAQAAEAKEKAYCANATIGMACSDGKPLRLSAIAEQFPSLNEAESVAYAPTAGVEKLRAVWKEHIVKKNPALHGGGISLPVITPGITAGISYSADLFLGAGNTIIASLPCWDNYSLIFEERREARIKGVPFFKDGLNGLDLDAIERAVKQEAASGTVRIILNFPNNPAGYAPNATEAAALVRIVGEAADGGADVLVICDDAYFGLFYEAETFGQSLFAGLAALHDRVLAIKIDGPTKEDYMWGLRLAAVTFGSRGLTADCYNALVKKLMGAVRSSVSCSNTPAQFAFLKADGNSGVEAEKRAFFDMLQRRYDAVKHFIANHPPPPPYGRCRSIPAIL